MPVRCSTLLGLVALALVEVASFQLLRPSAHPTKKPSTAKYPSLEQIGQQQQQQQQQQRHHEQSWRNEGTYSTILFSASADRSDDDDFSDFDTEIPAADGKQTQQLKQPKAPASQSKQQQQQQSVFQTEGGVIMPEGGANPCVIKVRCVSWFLCSYPTRK
jgi:hypothetical protein